MRDSRTVYEVAKGSNLDLLIRGFHGIANRAIDSLNGIGAGLQAIALALSTPQDNSQQVQEKIDKYTNRVGSQTAALQNAVNKREGD